MTWWEHDLLYHTKQGMVHTHPVYGAAHGAVHGAAHGGGDTEGTQESWDRDNTSCRHSPWL